MSDSDTDRDCRCDYAEVFVDLIEQAFLTRKEAHEKTLPHQQPIDVCNALLARQVTLAKHLACTPSFWTVRVAPLIFRCMTEINMNLAWITQDADPRSKRFVKYGLGQAKLGLEHRRSMKHGEGTNVRHAEYIGAIQAWISQQRIEPLVDVNLASWSGKSTREMAQESGCEDVYEFEYLTMTRYSHVDWMFIFALYPVVIEGHDPESSSESYQALNDIPPCNELLLATKMVINTLNWYDKITGFCSSDIPRLKQFRDHIRPMRTSTILESISRTFIVQPDSGIEINKFQYNLGKTLTAISKNTSSSIDLRIDRIREAFHEPDITAVIVPLLGRLKSLMEHYIGSPQAWNGHVAPIILRAIAEVMLILSWLSGDLTQRSRQFIDASILHARGDLERLNKSLRERKFSSDAGIMRDLMKSRIESMERLFPRDRNQTRVPSLRTIAIDGDCLDLYNVDISEWSACVHSSWHHVGFYNLINCDNPLHRFHRIPVIATLKCDFRRLQPAIECCDKALSTIDGILGVGQDQSDFSLLEVFEKEMAHIQTEQSHLKSNSGGGRDHSDKSSDVHPMKREEQHIEEHFEQIRAAAMRGDREAQFSLGQAHWEGVLSDSDISEALRLFIRAAEQGHPYAQYQLAFIYTRGPVEYRDSFEALVWLIRLATFAQLDTDLEDEITALRMEVTSRLSVEQLTRARDRALNGTD